MKVAFFCGYPFVGQRFGVAEYIYQLCQALARRQIACHVLAMHHQTRSRQVHPNVWVHTVKRKPIHYIYPSLAAHELKTLTQQIDPDIVNLHGTMLPYTWAAFDVTRHYPVLVTVHGDVAEEVAYKPFISKLWARVVSVPLMRQALSRLNNFLVLSSYMKDKLAKLTQGFIHVVPGGVDTHKYNIDPSVDVGAFSYGLFIGRLHKVKGPGLVLSALPRVIKSAGPISVYFAGKGPEQEHLINIAKQKGLESNTRFLGFISGSPKVDIIQQASFVIVPSLYEPFGLVSLEAMACGKPVIAARVGGIPEIVRHRETGLLFDAENATQLAECMGELLQNPEIRLQYGRAARRRAESYAWSEVGNQMIAVYRECAAHFGK